MGEPQAQAAAKQGWTSDDWYAEGEGQLHFFPRPHRLLWTVGRKIVADAEAWGGSAPEKGEVDENMVPRPTTPGTYVISGHGPYTTDTWSWSQIAWGTPLKVDEHRQHVLFQAGGRGGEWRRVDEVILGLTKGRIQREFRRLYPQFHPRTRQLDRDGDAVPDAWVFNDFGPWAVRYFVDPNRNRILDRGETRMGEMIHTTPENEAAVLLQKPLELKHSHGCIHISPIQRNRFLHLRAFEKGNLMVVHGPRDPIPEFLVR